MIERKITDILIDDKRPSGFVLNINRDEYHHSQRLNFSTIKTGFLGDSALDPGMIKESYEGYRPPTNSQQDSFDRGTYAHLLLLQPEDIATRVTEWKGGWRAGAEWDEFEKQHPAKLIMKSADMRTVEIACREFRTHKSVRDLLRGHDTEVAVFDKIGSVYVRGLLDAVSSAGVGSILDPKTGRCGLDERSIKNTIRKFRYVEQLGFYWHIYQRVTGCEINAVNLLFIQLPPERIGIVKVKLTTAKLQLGAARVLAAIRAIEERIAANEWPTFFAEYIHDVELWELDDVDLEGIA